MTNEELATLIQNGDDGYLPTLWEQVRKLIRMKAEQYHRYLVLSGGGNYAVDVDDLTQCGYYAVLDAVKYYSPSAGYKFTTYLDKTLKKAFREAMGIRTSKQDPCMGAASLDNSCREDDETPLIDLIDSHDSSLIQVEESVYNQELRRELTAALQKLPEAEREVLTLRFFFGISYREQAENKMVTVQNILVESAHGGEIVAVSVTLEQLQDSFFDTSSDLFDALFIGLFFGHGLLLSYNLNCMLNFVHCIDFIVQISYNIGKKGDVFMASTTTNISIRMDSNLKAQAEALFSELGMNLTTAFNIFVRQSLREGGIPFEISLNQPNKETVAAMLEAERIAKDPTVKGYSDLDELFADLKA